MASIFSKIISGEIPCHKVAESQDFIAFLDIQPLVIGHVLVVPKKEVDYIFDCDDEALAGLMIFSKTVAEKMRKVIACKRIGVTVIGLEVPHAHIHLIPINGVADMNFQQPKLSLSHKELSEVAEIIRNA